MIYANSYYQGNESNSQRGEVLEICNSSDSIWMFILQPNFTTVQLSVTEFRAQFKIDTIIIIMNEVPTKENLIGNI